MINFNSKITKKVLPYFLLNPHEELYLNEIANKFAVDRANLSRKLTEWTREGILDKRKQGNLSLYKVNQRYPLLKEMQGIAQKSFGLEREMTETLRKIKNLKKAYIFGSYASKQMSEESDIDLLLIGEHDFLSAQKEINKLQKVFNREINTVDMSEVEFKKKQQSDFIKNIFQSEHVRLI